MGFPSYRGVIALRRFGWLRDGGPTKSPAVIVPVRGLGGPIPACCRPGGFLGSPLVFCLLGFLVFLLLGFGNKGLLDSGGVIEPVQGTRPPVVFRVQVPVTVSGVSKLKL